MLLVSFWTCDLDVARCMMYITTKFDIIIFLLPGICSRLCNLNIDEICKLKFGLKNEMQIGMILLCGMT